MSRSTRWSVRCSRSLESGEAPTSLALTVDEGIDRAYLDFLAGTFTGNLSGMKLVIDAAHGAASHLAPDLFEKLGAQVDCIGCSPDGRNINLNCGSLHLEHVRARVLETGADLGIAFDGDADRALFVSHSGKIIDGDAVLLICALPLHAAGRLKEVVATVMSNLGLERALRNHGIALVRTDPGRRQICARRDDQA